MPQTTQQHPVSTKAGVQWRRMAFAAIMLLCGWMGRLEAAQYLHRSWHFEDGLPQNYVQAVCQTRDGYLWVGTQKGLSRFDGVKFTVFNDKNTPELKDSHIYALSETPDGSLWIGTFNGGVTRFKDGKFTGFTKDQGLADNATRCLFTSRDGTLWIGTTNGVSRFKDERFDTYTEESNLAYRVVRAIGEDQDGAIWFATGSGALSRLHNGEFTNFGVQHGLGPSSLRAVHVDRNGVLWAGGTTGLFQMTKSGRFKKFTTKHGLADNNVTSIFEDSTGTLWVGSYGGLNRYENGHFITETTMQGLAYDVVNAIIEDQEGSIWIAAKDGLSRLNVRRFTTYTKQNGLTHNNVISVCEDADNSMWLATWGGGLNHLTTNGIKAYTTEHGVPKAGLFSDMLVSLHKDRQGRLWVGGDYEAGVYQFENGFFTRYARSTGHPVDSGVKVIYQDTKGDLWIGTASSLARNRNGNFTRFSTEDGLVGNNIRALLEDRSGALWIGTQTGLSRRVNDRFESFTTTNGLSHNTVIALYEDTARNLWIGTMGGGLNRYKDGRFTTYTTHQGLSSDDVFEIIEDDLGYFWMSCRTGVFRVSRKSFDEFDAGRIKSIPSTAYGKADGMVTVECNSIGKPAGWKSRDGRIWFATAKGLIVIDPRTDLKPNYNPPPVYIETVVADGNPLPTTETIRLPPGRGELEIHYTALSLRAPEKNQFKYRLKGFSDSWVEAGTRRTAYYNNLRPGDYEFQVIASNNDGLWNETGANLRVTLKPHVWQTGWFYSLCAGLVIATTAGTIHLRLRNLKRHQVELQSLVGDRTKELKHEIQERKQAEEALRLSQETLLRQERLAAVGELAAGIAHEFNNILTVIQGHTSILSGSPNLDAADAESLKQINAGAGRAARLTRQMLAFGRKQFMQPQILDLNDIVARSANMLSPVLGEKIVLRLRCAPDLPQANLDSGMIEQVVVNIALNARDAMPEGGRLEIATCPAMVTPDRVQNNPEARQGKFVCLTISDTGCGMGPETMKRVFEPFFTTKEVGKGTGLGLASVYGIIKQHHGWVEVSSQLGKGSTFQIFLPIAEAKPTRTHEPVAPALPLRGGTETILVAEDEPDLRKLVSTVLTRHGYRVLAAESGVRALELWAKHSGDIQLLLTDMVMPNGMSGRELADQLLTKKPNLKVIFSSGYNRDMVEKGGSLPGGSAFLAKPYPPDKLLRLVRDSLDDRENTAFLSKTDLANAAAEASR